MTTAINEIRGQKQVFPSFMRSLSLAVAGTGLLGCMSHGIGIVGLPNVVNPRSHALTSGDGLVDLSLTTIEPNLGVVPFPTPG